MKSTHLLASLVVCGTLGLGGFPKTTGQPTETLLFGLPNCQELLPGTLNLHWDVSEDGTVLDLALEGIASENNQYMAFGFSPAGDTTAEMVGAGTVIAGNIGDEFFGKNYVLTRKGRCDASGEGVCPDPMQDVEVVQAERDADTNVMAIHVRRSLGDWPLDGSRVSIWAMGSVGDGSSIESPDIGYHGAMRTSPGSSATVVFSEATNTCSKLA